MKTTWTAPGTRPTIEFGTPKEAEHGTPAHYKPMTSGFQMADHTQLASLNIRGGRPAVAIEDAEHVYLSDVDIRDAEGAGIAMHNAHHIALKQVSIDDVDSPTYMPKNWVSTDDQTGGFWVGAIHQGSGIAGVKSSDVTIQGAHIQETHQAGIKFFKSQDITIEDSVIEDTRGPGLSFLKTENVTLHNVELRDVGNYEGYTSESGSPDDFMVFTSGDATAMPSTDWSLKRAGIELRQTQHTRIEHLTVREAGSYGIWADGAVDTTLDAIDIRGADHGMWFKNSQDVFITGAHIELPGAGPKWVSAWPEIGLFDFVTGATVASSDVVTIGTADVPAQHHGIVFTEVTGSAVIRDSHIAGGSDGLGIWTQNHQDGTLDLTIGNNIIDGKAISLDAGGNSVLTVRVKENEIGGDGWSVNVDGGGQGTSNLGFFDNHLDGTFHALAVDEREMNLAFEGNQLSDGPHMIANRDDASVYLRYRNNRSPDEVVFESMGAVFGLEPISGNDHTPTQIGEITPLNPISVRLRAPGIFN